MDTIVRLFDLPPAPTVPGDVMLRQPVAYGRQQVVRWVDQRSGELWAGETATALDGLRQRGFTYAIIGKVGPADVYARHFAAEPIPGSGARPVPAVQVAP